jgi:hypothetical protein
MSYKEKEHGLLKMNLAVKSGRNSSVAGIMLEALALRTMTTSKPVLNDCYAKSYRNSKEDRVPQTWTLHKLTIKGKLKRNFKDTKNTVDIFKDRNCIFVNEDFTKRNADVLTSCCVKDKSTIEKAWSFEENFMQTI